MIKRLTAVGLACSLSLVVFGMLGCGPKQPQAIAPGQIKGTQSGSRANQSVNQPTTVTPQPVNDRNGIAPRAGGENTIPLPGQTGYQKPGSSAPTIPAAAGAQGGPVVAPPPPGLKTGK